MSSRFERAYRVTGTTVVDAEFWNRVMRELDTRIVGIEEKKANFEEAERTLLDLGLRRINETLLPAAQVIRDVSEMGFLIASSEEALEVEEGATVSLTLVEGRQRELFTPSPFVALTRRSTVDDYAIARVVTYSRETGILVLNIESVHGNPGPHNDWDVAAVAGSVIAQMAVLEQTQELREAVAADKATVASDKATVASHKAAAETARNEAQTARTGAEAALASFLQVYRGALAEAPSDGEQGHFYFDTVLQMARVYTASGWAPLFQVTLGGIRQGFITASAGQTEFVVDGDFTFLCVYRNGVMLVAGVDYTTASPSFTLAEPAFEGDDIAYVGYYATGATDFYTKVAADERFVRFDGEQELTEGQQEQARLNLGWDRPTGSIIYTTVDEPAPWTIFGEGALLSRTTYARLWEWAQEYGRVVSEVEWVNDRGAYSSGDGSTTFRVPDLRGEFIRVLDGGRGVDTGRTLGSWQADAFKSHTHNFQRTNSNNAGLAQVRSGGGDGTMSGQETTAAGGTETRPRNVAYRACIYY